MDKVNLNFRVGAHHKTSKLKHRKFYFINLTKLTVWGQYISNYKVQRLSVLTQEEYLKLCKNNSKINYFFPHPSHHISQHHPLRLKNKRKVVFQSKIDKLLTETERRPSEQIQTMTTPADHAVSLKRISDIINLFVSTLHSKIHDYQ